MKTNIIQEKINHFFLSSNSNELELKVLKEELQKLMGLDDLNLSYFLSLYAKYKNKGQKISYQIAQQDDILQDMNSKDRVIAVPTAIASEKTLEEMPIVEYESLLTSVDITKAKDCVLWAKKMQAGTGSSMTRTTYLAKKKKCDVKNISIGAKGTDLFIRHKEDEISLAYAQIRQLEQDVLTGPLGGVIFHDIVSSETKTAIDEIWNDLKLDKKATRFNHTVQAQLPTLDSNFEISYNRKAPGGHALFGVEALLAAFKSHLRPKVVGKTLISSIGNGEDLGSSPDAVIISWMKERKIPIAMITTTKTGIDLKGGQLMIVKKGDLIPVSYVAMIEKAQAQESNQLEYFEQLGLLSDHKKAFFNTNMVILNYDVLSEMIEALVQKIGESEFLKIIAPDLILNQKSQIDGDGVKRNYIQLEGAMGSVFLNLDKYWRMTFKKPIVHFLNIDTKHRTRFFSPIKTAFDYFMQFHSDRFKFDENTYRLIDLKPGHLPNIALKNSYYDDVENVLAVFKNTKIINLNKLEVTGLVDFTGCNLEGNVEIISLSDKMINLVKVANVDTIKDRKIIIDSNQNIKEE